MEGGKTLAFDLVSLSDQVCVCACVCVCVLQKATDYETLK